MCCSDLNENVSHSVWHLNPCSPVDQTMWGVLECVAFVGGSMSLEVDFETLKTHAILKQLLRHGVC